ncbi:MAG: hypothetical protein FJY20_03230 [Bacteroidetes bacterium]|nr:hypothetical protein [Bacteroidota bacterium]
MNFICFNGKLLPGHEPVLLADNRSYRYGDGLFETMKVIRGNIMLESFHFDRLFTGLSLLKFEIEVLFTAQKISRDILALCKKNNCFGRARIRLSVFRGGGGLYELASQMQYLVECWALDEAATSFNENGLVIDIFPHARKSCDKFSNLKTSSFLPYSMAAIYAKDNRLNDCGVLNTHDRIADTTNANVFIVKGNMIITPPLSEGCISGVMRRHILTTFPASGISVYEKPLEIKDLEGADEVFLTNAVKGIKWVKEFRNKFYTCKSASEIFRML